MDETKENSRKYRRIVENTRAAAIVSRRSYLRVAGGAGLVTATAGCLGGGSSEEPLRASTFGGPYKQTLDAQLFEPFEEDTGIPIETEAQGSTAEVIPNIESAVQNGDAPIDVLTLGIDGVLRGINSDVWLEFDSSQIDNFDNVMRNTYDNDDRLVGVGALNWLIAIAYNEEIVSNPPTSWSALWDSQYEGQFGAMTPASVNYLPDVTAELFFDGPETLDSEQGIRDVFEELENIAPQINQFFSNQADHQARLAEGEIPMGALYHDITLVLQDQGEPVDTVFPAEGAINGEDRWVSPRTTDKEEEVHAFIDYASQPEVQDRICENLYTTPMIPKSQSTLDDETYERIAGPGLDEAIQPNHAAYVENAELINRRWEELIIGG
jgi:putative spermidine/putrescine transport system substrate-binding protein